MSHSRKNIDIHSTGVKQLKPFTNYQQSVETDSKSVRRSPTNIRTNPNYTAGQKAYHESACNDDGRSLGYNATLRRPRSLVILGTQRRSRESIDFLTPDKSPDLGIDFRDYSKGLSSPDINDRRGLPSRDLDQTRGPQTRRNHSSYQHRISYPQHNDRGNANQSHSGLVNSRTMRSTSLDMLKKSHECLQMGGKCSCSLTLYRNDSDDVITKDNLTIYRSLPPKNRYKYGILPRPQSKRASSVSSFDRILPSYKSESNGSSIASIPRVASQTSRGYEEMLDNLVGVPKSVESDLQSKKDSKTNMPVSQNGELRNGSKQSDFTKDSSSDSDEFVRPHIFKSDSIQSFNPDRRNSDPKRSKVVKAEPTRIVSKSGHIIGKDASKASSLPALQKEVDKSSSKHKKKKKKKKKSRSKSVSSSIGAVNPFNSSLSSVASSDTLKKEKKIVRAEPARIITKPGNVNNQRDTLIDTGTKKTISQSSLVPTIKGKEESIDTVDSVPASHSPASRADQLTQKIITQENDLNRITDGLNNISQSVPQADKYPAIAMTTQTVVASVHHNGAVPNNTQRNSLGMNNVPTSASRKQEPCFPQSGNDQRNSGISDNEVSSFFQPSSTVWKPGMSRFYSVPANLTEGKASSIKFVPKPQTDKYDHGLNVVNVNEVTPKFSTSTHHNRIAVDSPIKKEYTTQQSCPPLDKYEDSKANNSLKMGIYQNIGQPITRDKANMDRTARPMYETNAYKPLQNTQMKSKEEMILPAPAENKFEKYTGFRNGLGPGHKYTSTFDKKYPANAIPRLENNATSIVQRSNSAPVHVTSKYVYQNEEEKSKVIALLDRYAVTGGITTMGMTRQDINKYLTSAKKQLGLIKEPQGGETMKNKKVVLAEPSKVIRNSQDRINSLSEEPVKSVPYMTENGDIQNGSGSEISLNKKKVTIYDRPRHILKAEPTKIVHGSKTNGVSGKENDPIGILKKNSNPATNSAITTEVLQCINNNLNEGNEEEKYEEVLKQTTFHLDGAVTDSLAIRKRKVVPLSSSKGALESDKNPQNKDNEKNMGRTTETNSGLEIKDKPDSGHVVYRQHIPVYCLWQASGPFFPGKYPSQLMDCGMGEKEFDRCVPALNKCTRTKQINNIVRSSLTGCYLAVIFLLLWLLGSVICYFSNMMPRAGAGVFFIVSVLLVLVFVSLLHFIKFKLKHTLQASVLEINEVMSLADIYVSLLTPGACTRGVDILFIYLDFKLCERTLSHAIKDKSAENHLLTKVSQNYPQLLTRITTQLEEVSEQPDEFGKKVIVHCLLIHFVSPYLDTFFMKKGLPSGKTNMTGHGSIGSVCFCDYIKEVIMKKVFYSETSIADAMKLPACKPTSL